MARQLDRPTSSTCGAWRHPVLSGLRVEGAVAGAILALVPAVVGAQGIPVTPKACAHVAVPGERAECYRLAAEHFAGVERYADLNAALGAPAAGESRVVFFGDSIVEGWSHARAGGFFPGKPYVNRGIGGQTTAQMLLRFRQDVIALRPALVFIVAGTNDVAGNAGPTSDAAIAANLESMADLARAHGIRVIVAAPLPVCDCARAPEGTAIVQTRERPPERLAELGRWIAAWTRASGFGFADFASAVSDAQGRLRADLTDDGLHPNAAGYAALSRVADAAIAAELERPAPPRAAAAP